MKAIEARVQAAVAAASGAMQTPMQEPVEQTEGQKLAHGPQLPAASSSQAEIDRLLASFD